MKTIYALIFSLSCCCFCCAQEKLQRLLVAEYRVDSPQIGRYSYLTAYNFKKGKFVSIDTIFHGPISGENASIPHANFQSYNIVHKNRYVVTKYGTVIDVKTEKVISNSGDYFIEARGDTLIYYRRNETTGTGYLALDLNTGAYGFIKENSWYKPTYKTASPNNKYYLSLDQRKIPYSVLLNDHAGNSRILVTNAKSGPYLSGDTQFPNVETFWLNNNSFIYALYHRRMSPEKVFYHRVELRRYNLADSSDQFFAALDSVPRGRINGRFSRSYRGDILYAPSGGSDYLLDTVHKTLDKYINRELAHSFTISFSTSGTSFMYRGKPIGIFRASRFYVEDGMIATNYIEKESVRGNAKGIKIWTSKTKKWTTFDIPWSIGIIGWVAQ